MARVEFNFPSRNIRKQAPLGTVKRIEQLESWLKAAKKAIPEIPEIGGNADQFEVHYHYADLNYVKFDLMNGRGERCYVTIDRKASCIG